MPDTTFSAGTVITSDWLNEVNVAKEAVVNVKDPRYGATGDDTTDDTAALDAVAAAVAAGGYRITIPAGTYLYNGVWTITADNITLEGDGYASCIVNTDTTTDNSYTVRMVGDNCTARNFRIDGKKADITATLTKRMGLRMEGDYASAEGMFVHDTLTTGISIGFGIGPRVHGCRVYDIGYVSGHQDAIGIVVSTATQPSVVNNVVYSTGRSGIFSYDSTGVSITGNSVDTCENGIRVANASQPAAQYSTIAGNTVVNGTGDGIRFTGNKITVSGNICNANAGSGALSGGGEDQTISGNTFTGNTQNGIRIGQEDGPTVRLTITGNNCSGNTGNGIYFVNSTSAVTDAVLIGNNLTGNTDKPIRLVANSSASTLYMADNHWSNASVPVLQVSGWTVSRPGPSHAATASASTITLYGDGYHGVSGTADISTITIMPAGNAVILYFVGTAATNGLVDGAGNLRLAGNFAYTPNATIHLVSNGTNWVEVSRSTN